MTTRFPSFGSRPMAKGFVVSCFIENPFSDVSVSVDYDIKGKACNNCRLIFVLVLVSTFLRASSSHHPPRDNLPEPGPSSSCTTNLSLIPVVEVCLFKNECFDV